MQSDQRWMAVARLLRPQGRRGEILAEPLTDRTELFAAGAQFQLAESGRSAAAAPSVTLEDCWQPQGRNAGRLVLKLAGVDSISQAESLQQRELFLPESALPALESDTYFVRDLLECQLFDGDRLLGTIADLQFPIAADGHTRLPNAADLLVVEPAVPTPEGEPVLVPFVKAWLETVDLPGKRIIMHLPPGLLD